MPDLPPRSQRHQPRKQDTDLPRRRPDVRGPNGRVTDPNWHEHGRRWRRRVTLTCDTPGCPNNGRLWDDLIDDNADGIDRVMCGLCGEWIESIVDHPTERGFTHASFKAAHGGREWNGDVPEDDLFNDDGTAP